MKEQKEQNLFRLSYKIDGVLYFEELVEKGKRLTGLPKVKKEPLIFSGWGDVPTRMPNHDLVLDGHFEKITCTVSFYSGVELHQKIQVGYADPIPSIEEPIQEGYHFIRWENLPEKALQDQIIVQGVFEPNEYNVIYVVDEQTRFVLKGQYGEPCPLLENPTKENYEFSGWDEVPGVMPSHDVVIKGYFNECLYTLKLMLGEEVFKEQKLKAGTPIDKKIKPVREGYYFSGWRKLPSEMPKEDLTIIGSMYPTRYLVEFFFGEELIDKKYVPFGDCIPLPELSLEQMKDFLGWENLPATMPSHDLKLYPSKDLTTTSNEMKEHMVSFMIGDTIVHYVSLHEGEEIICPDVEEKPGYTFSGWENVPSKMPNEKLTIVGSYVPKEVSITYIVDKKVYLQTKQLFHTKLEYPNIEATKSNGATFLGWVPSPELVEESELTIEGGYSDASCLLEFYLDGTLSKKVYHALSEELVLPHFDLPKGEVIRWDHIPEHLMGGVVRFEGVTNTETYTLSFVDGEQILAQFNYAPGTPIEVHIPTPEHENEAFLSWDHIPQTMPHEDVVVKALFNKNTHHIKFVLDGILLAEYDVTIGSKTPTPIVPEKEGYVFSGWENYVEIMPNYNFTSHGKYIPQKYVISFYCANEIYLKQEYQFGQAIVPPEAPNKQHFTFRFWEGLPTVMPSKNLNVSARYQGDLFRISYLIDGKLVSFSDFEMGNRIVPPEPPQKKGYRFAGWDHLPEFMPDKELIVNGSYVESTHSVTYKVDGVIYRIETYEIGAFITPPTPPEKEHEKFVRWNNFTSWMPEYDFICTAVYTEVYAHYSFVLEGKVLLEGVLKKGEAITPPPIERKPGFRFGGWSNFTGKMGEEDSIYEGKYVEDQYKVYYEVSGSPYFEQNYDSGATIEPIMGPEVEGYWFGGWKNLPKKMPMDDVYVKGELYPNKYPLLYTIDNKEFYRGEVPYQEELGFVLAPKVHGKEFNGWENEPERMPNEGISINGTYSFALPKYKEIATPCEKALNMDNAFQKKYPMQNDGIAFVSGGYLRILVGGKAFTLLNSTKYIVDTKVIDLWGLCESLKKTYSKYKIPKKKLTLLIDAPVQTDFIFDTQPLSLEMLTQGAKDQLLSSLSDGGEYELLFKKLSSNGVFGTNRLLASALDKRVLASYYTAFSKVGVGITQANTLTSALIEYLHFNRGMERNLTQIAFFYLPTSITTVLLVDGQVTYVLENEYPYDSHSLDVLSETKNVMDKLIKHLQQLDYSTPLQYICVGGIDRTKVELVTGQIAKIIKEKLINTKILSSKTKSLNIVELGFAHTENRIK